MDKETINKLINIGNRIADGIDTHNKIMSSFLLQATSESLFKKMTDEDIKKFVPKYVNTLDKVRDAAGIDNEL
jgi:hypothetical protein|tara:strand:+ start:574 stop:792 length:219 start_codon:yes stop_codon:yes gene_type:complete